MAYQMNEGNLRMYISLVALVLTLRGAALHFPGHTVESTVLTNDNIRTSHALKSVGYCMNGIKLLVVLN